MQIQGKVIHGKKQARELGYPTANIEYSTSYQPASGVWTCWILVKGSRYLGLGVVGMWKLAEGGPSLEVHVLDFMQDIYGEVVEVRFGERLRPLEKFESMEKLKIQIEQDVATGRAWFAKQNS